jgi:hypothetical protein
VHGEDVVLQRQRGPDLHVLWRSAHRAVPGAQRARRASRRRRDVPRGSARGDNYRAASTCRRSSGRHNGRVDSNRSGNWTTSVMSASPPPAAATTAAAAAAAAAATQRCTTYTNATPGGVSDPIRRRHIGDAVRHTNSVWQVHCAATDALCAARGSRGRCSVASRVHKACTQRQRRHVLSGALATRMTRRGVRSHLVLDSAPGCFALDAATRNGAPCLLHAPRSTLPHRAACCLQGCACCGARKALVTHVSKAESDGSAEVVCPRPAAPCPALPFRVLRSAFMSMCYCGLLRPWHPACCAAPALLLRAGC